MPILYKKNKNLSMFTPNKLTTTGFTFTCILCCAQQASNIYCRNNKVNKTDKTLYCREWYR